MTSALERWLLRCMIGLGVLWVLTYAAYGQSWHMKLPISQQIIGNRAMSLPEADQQPEKAGFRISGQRMPVESLKASFGRIPVGVSLFSCQICSDKNGSIHSGKIIAEMAHERVLVIPVELALLVEQRTRDKALSVLGHIAPMAEGVGIAATVANAVKAIELGPVLGAVAAFAPPVVGVLVNVGKAEKSASDRLSAALELQSKLLQPGVHHIVGGECISFWALTRFDKKRTPVSFEHWTR